MKSDTSMIRCVRRRGHGLHSVLAVVFLTCLTFLNIGSTVALAEVVLKPQEILDALRWGIERNRSPEDIQQDIDGINAAAGGSGTVPLPVSLMQVETRDGLELTVTPVEALKYNWAKNTVEHYVERDAVYQKKLDSLWGEEERWVAWRDENIGYLIPMARGFAALNQMAEVDQEYETKKEIVRLEIKARNRKPDRMVYGEAYEHYDTYDEALGAWQNREQAIEDLNSQIRMLENERIDRLRDMIRPDDDDTLRIPSERLSWINRPGAMLRTINDSLDYYRDARRANRETVAEKRRILAEFEKRTTGEGGPPVDLTTRSTAQQGEDTGGGASADDGAGDGHGEGDGNGDGDEQVSLDDLLREFGADEEGDDDSGDDASGSRTELVNEEILADIQGKFDAAVYDFERCHSDFEGQLNGLAGEPPEVVCADTRLAGSYACVEDQFYYISGYYDEAHDRISSAEPRVNWEEMQMDSDIHEDGRSRVSPMDQITITLINSKYDRVSEMVGSARDGLGAQAPGCDPDDLRNAAARASGFDDDSADQDDWGSGSGDDGGSRGDDRGSGGGNEEVAEGLHFQKLSSPTVQGSNNPARCSGGTLTIKQSGGVSFPDEIWPGQNYSVEFSLTWETQGNDVEAVEVGGSAFFMDPANILREEYNAFSAFRSFRFTFSTANVDFSREGGVITVIYGGSIDCESGSGDTGGTVIVQAYERVGN